jgi:hypothetical protein
MLVPLSEFEKQYSENVLQKKIMTQDFTYYLTQTHNQTEKGRQDQVIS